jgi:hypothetical protein
VAQALEGLRGEETFIFPACFEAPHERDLTFIQNCVVSWRQADGEAWTRLSRNVQCSRGEELERGGELNLEWLK